MADGSEEVVMVKGETVGVDASTVTLALAMALVLTVLTAVTVTAVLLETAGAVYRPALEIVPLEACQVTLLLLVPCTDALNCCEPPEGTEATLGETATLTGVLGATVTSALDCAVGSAALVAVTVTLVLLETVGAMNIPPLPMEPALAAQVTAVLLVP